MKRIEELRELIKSFKVDAYIIPSTDEWRNEYTPIHKKRLEWICGFSGSNGVLIVTQKDLILFTDSRYTTQAKVELNDDFKIIDMHSAAAYDVMEICKGCVIGYDPMIQNFKEIQHYENIGKKFGFEIKSVDENLVDLLKGEENIVSQVQNFPIEVAGMSAEDKIDAVIKKLPNECNCLISTSPASICWLLNIRGNDIQYNPLILCYAIIDVKTKVVKLFVNISNSLEINYKLVEFYPIDEFKKHIKQLNHLRLAFDQDNSSIWLSNNISHPISLEDPTVRLRAIKNSVELDGFKKAHIHDGVALCKFWFWLYKSIHNGFKVDEISAAEKLSKFRHMNAEFVDESFGTISGYGSNGAIVHYQSQESTCKSIPRSGEDAIYLLDSGGHYSCAGTTDTTRVFNIALFADGLKDEHKIAYTAVLKGHISLAKAVFPVGTNGSQIDSLARYFLWQKGLDYGHGTGHGVGHFSSVHEGPQGITKKNTVILEENMIISIEPGYYKEGSFGMRIENLYAVRKSSKFDGFLEFDMLTMVPIETSLIDFNTMDKDEIEWLANHNRVAIDAVKSELTKDELEFIISNSSIKNN